MKLVLLWTDMLVFILIAGLIVFGLYSARHEHLRAPWREVISSRRSVIAVSILSIYIIIGLFDCVHFRLEETTGGETHYSSKVYSLLDIVFHDISKHVEKTYSSPFALTLYTKENIEQADGSIIRDYPRLVINSHIPNLSARNQEIMSIIIYASIKALLISSAIIFAIMLLLKRRRKCSLRALWSAMNQRADHEVPWLLFFGLIVVLTVLGIVSFELAKGYHIFGTDKVGEDVFYQSVKSIRTGLIIGTVTTLVMLPFAIMLGLMAGYFRGFVDDVIQYIYTTLSSIPGVLLIAAAILMLQLYMSKHPESFESIIHRQDARLLALCIILGVTSWTSLCRLLRGETLKLRELDYIMAAKSLGVSHFQILIRHILPNVMPLILIAIAIDFSGLVLAEAVLSYVGVGVDPATQSWGNMINQARLELARIPVVWWSLTAAFVFMFALVLSANIFSDAVRDAFDPRLRQQ